MVCDLAEYYHVFDYRGLPVFTLAALVCGLRADSRTKMKLAGIKVDMNTLLLASLVDRVGLLLWAQTRDSRSGANKPKSIVDSLLNPDNLQENDGEILTFSTPQEFELMKQKILYGKEE